MGWASHGMNAQKASRIRSEIVQNIKEGKGFQSLKEKRQIEQDRKNCQAAAVDLLQCSFEGLSLRTR